MVAKAMIIKPIRFAILFSGALFKPSRLRRYMMEGLLSETSEAALFLVTFSVIANYTSKQFESPFGEFIPRVIGSIFSLKPNVAFAVTNAPVVSELSFIAAIAFISIVLSAVMYQPFARVYGSAYFGFVFRLFFLVQLYLLSVGVLFLVAFERIGANILGDSSFAVAFFSFTLLYVWVSCVQLIVFMQVLDNTADRSGFSYFAEGYFHLLISGAKIAMLWNFLDGNPPLLPFSQYEYSR